MKERQNCWIRGHMDEKDYQDDLIRLATIRCPYRKGQTRNFLLGRQLDYDCNHPAFLAEHVEIEALPDGGIMAGGVNGYATFCEPVNQHLVSLGEPSRLIVDGEA